MDKEYSDKLKKLNKMKTNNSIVDLPKIFNKNFNEFMSTLTNFSNIEELTNVDIRRLLDSIVVNGNNIEINFKISSADFKLDDLNSIPIVSTINIKFKTESYIKLS